MYPDNHGGRRIMEFSAWYFRLIWLKTFLAKSCKGKPDCEWGRTQALPPRRKVEPPRAGRLHQKQTKRSREFSLASFCISAYFFHHFECFLLSFQLHLVLALNLISDDVMR